jgi:hypothetical protein
MSSSMWSVVRLVTAKYELYQFLTEDEKKLAADLAQQPEYSAYARSCCFVLEMI